MTREYVEFPNLCFVDTLDSIEGLGRFAGHQAELFGALSEENYDRIKRQNRRKISVVIGNPPYNANQIRENDNNKNRKYPNIDARIKATYLARSTAQKTKLYDPYVRFFRWASDRIHDAGVVAFITNRSYIDARNFDGFRRTVVDEFDEIYIIDLGGDWKKQGVAGGGNVFGIGTGVAVGFWIRRPGKEKKAGRLFYATAPEGSGDEKLAWLASLNDDGRSFGNIHFDEIVPKSGYWVNNPEVEFGSELPIVSKDVKLSKRGASDKAIFKLFSLGVSTNRDEWLYDYERSNLRNKVRYLVDTYNGIEPSTKNFPDTLKWSRNLKRRLGQERRETFSERRIVEANYRPFTKALLYKSDLFVDELGHADELFPRNEQNTAICFTDPHAQKPWFVCAVNGITDLHYVGAGAGTVCLGRYRFVHGDRIDNITNWTLDQFTGHYHGLSNALTKDFIFHYVYGVFHDPLYREKYALNLRREYPRVPLYKDFWRWARWGEELMALHLGYETVDPWPLKRVDVEDQSSRRAGFAPKAILRANKEEGIIRLNGETQLLGIPATAWDYKLGIRSALEWILDQYGESTPRDDVIRERFDCYSFSEHKEQVIDLLCRMTRVSVETQRIVGQMRKLTER